MSIKCAYCLTQIPNNGNKIAQHTYSFFGIWTRGEICSNCYDTINTYCLGCDNICGYKYSHRLCLKCNSPKLPMPSLKYSSCVLCLKRNKGNKINRGYFMCTKCRIYVCSNHMKRCDTCKFKFGCHNCHKEVVRCPECHDQVNTYLKTKYKLRDVSTIILKY